MSDRPISFVHREARTIHECRTASDYSPGLARTLLQAFADTHAPDTLAHNAAVVFDSIPDVLAALEDSGGTLNLHNASYGLSFIHPARDAVREFRERQPVVTLVVVGCSQAKDDDPAAIPARERYASAYWTVKRRFAEEVADDWRICSAKHGLLHPDAPIAPYDLTVEDLAGVPVDASGDLPTGDPVTTRLDAWAATVHEALTRWVRRGAGSAVAPRDVQVLVFLGQRYERPLVERGAFDLEDATDATVAVRFPWRNADLGGIGEQMAWFNAEARRDP